MKRAVFASLIVVLAASLGPLGGTAAPYPHPGVSVTQADRILVKKGERKLYLLSGGTVLREYNISLGPNPDGHKYFSGDGRTPEGIYYIEYKNASSRFYRSLKISYPNQQDRLTSASYGLSAGGMIMIHGLPTNPRTGEVEQRSADWTEGCIAVTNREMDEIWAAVEPGTVVEIQP